MAQAPLQIAVVDDFAEDRAAIRRALRIGLERHFVCHEAANGEDALALCQAASTGTGPHLDVMLLDLRLPDLTGIEVLHALKQTLAVLPLPVVMLTGTLRESEALAALAAGAQDFIAKGQITPDTITRAVINAIERFRLVRELHASEALFRSAFEQAAVGMTHTDLDGRWRRVNQRFCDIVGYTSDKLLQLSFQAISHPDDLLRGSETVAQILAGEIESAALAERYYHSDGRLVWVKRTVSLVRDADGEADYFVSVIEDITALKEAEARLIASEERYHRVVEDQTELICRYGIDFRLTFVNQAYGTTVGQPAATLIGQSVLDYLTPEYHAPFLAHLARLNPAQPVATIEVPIHMANGNIHWFQWTNRLIVDQAGAPSEFQGVGHDITERKLAEAAEREQRLLAEALHDSLAALTSSLDVNQIMSQILAAANRVVPSDGGSIILIEGNLGRVAYLRGFGPEAQAFFQEYRFPISALLTEAVGSKRGAYLVPDIQDRPDWIQLPPTAWIRSTVGIPIELYGVVIGLLVLDSANPHHFQATDVEKLHAFAHYVGLALENAEHITQLEASVSARTAELRDAKETVEAILNNSRDGIVLIDPTLRIQQSNHAFHQLFGRQEHECAGWSLLNVVAPEDQAHIAAVLRSVLQTQRGTEVELGAIRRTGEHFAAELSIGPFKGEGLVCTLRDITERKRADDALRSQRDFLQLIIDNVPNPITVKDQGSRFLLVNQAMAQLYQVAPPAMIGKTHADFNQNVAEVDYFHQKDHEALAADRITFTAEEIVNGRYYQTSTIPLKDRDEQAAHILVVSTDISERKAAEEALQQALQREKELGELKSRFISMASHEFRTPLTVIRTTADTLLAYRAKLPPEQIDKRLGKIQEQVLYLRDIIEDVLQLTRLQTGRAEFNPEQLNLDTLCRNIIDELHSQLEGTHRLYYQCEGDLQELYLDKKMMRQIINNLLSNAIKYSPGEKPVRATLSYQHDLLVFQVCDEGIGIPAADLNHIFEPFHRAANVGNISGTGLGLVITKESVELQGGTLIVESQEGIGTTFTVTIPLPHNQAAH